MQAGATRRFMPLPLGFPIYPFMDKVYAGPYLDRFQGTAGFNLTPDIKTFSVCNLPIQDFSVPEDTAAVLQALRLAIRLVARGDAIYVGCRGGLGRTGLFLALMAKAVGVLDPIGHVRRAYNLHAVETTEQEEYVEEFDTSPLLLTVFQARIMASYRRVFC